jgi:prepilin-type N-terminal cleavage/methylation domain-containing protein
MNLRQNQKGFTIVELLIVVVVIAILAAISIVAYTGITNRANTSAAMEAANSVKSVAVAYNGANGGYPTSKALFVSGGTDSIARLPSDITFIGTADMSAGNPPTSPKHIIVQRSPASGTITGFRISYYKYDGGTVETMDVGTVNAASLAVMAN